MLEISKKLLNCQGKSIIVCDSNDMSTQLIVNAINSEDETNDKVLSIDSTTIVIEGFRVQLLATRDRVSAEKFQSELEQIYNEKIYIIFEAPNYKVRIGNFIDRQSAEKMRKDFSNKGYPSAWIIRTKIEPINN